jgi:hypothetical protein
MSDLDSRQGILLVPEFGMGRHRRRVVRAVSDQERSDYRKDRDYRAAAKGFDGKADPSAQQVSFLVPTFVGEVPLRVLSLYASPPTLESSWLPVSTGLPLVSL